MLPLTRWQATFIRSQRDRAHRRRYLHRLWNWIWRRPTPVVATEIARL